MIDWTVLIYLAVALPIAFKYLKFWKATHQNEYFNSQVVPPALELLVDLIIFVVATVLAPLALIDLVYDYIYIKKGEL